MDFEIAESATIKARIYGQSVELRRPTVGMIEAMEDQRAVLDKDKDKMALMKNFLSKLGMPEDLLGKLELDHYTQVIEFLLSPKKK